MESRRSPLDGNKTAEFTTVGFTPPYGANSCKKQNLMGGLEIPLSYSVKDLSFSLFMGLPLDAKYKNIHVASRNRKIIEFFSRPIA